MFQNKMYKLKLILSILSMAPFSMSVNATNCLDEYAKTDTCKASICAEAFKDYAGVWQSSWSQLEDSQLSTGEARLIFARSACLEDDQHNQLAIVGRETVVKAAGPTSAQRTVFNKVVISTNELSLNNPMSTTRVYKLSDVKLVEQGSQRQLILPEQEYQYRKLAAGEVSFFAGRAWVMTSEGLLVGSGEFVLKSDHDPETGRVREVMLYKGSRPNQAKGLEVSVLNVESESFDGSRTDRKLYGQKAQSSNLILDTIANGAIYREERIVLGPNKGMSIFKAGQQISALEFQKRLEQELGALSQERRPASKP